VTRIAPGVQPKRPAAAPPSPEVLHSIRADMERRGLNVLDRRMPSVTMALIVEPVDVPGLNEGIFYYEAALPQRVAAFVSPSRAVRGRPTTGRLTCLVLLVDFADNPGIRPPADIGNMLFSTKAYATGSLRDFYSENSYGQLDVDGQVTDWMRLPQPYAYYVDGNNGQGAYPHNSQRMVEDALVVAASQLNFQNFDTDGDGYIDGLFIVHAGGGAEADPNPTSRAQKMWSHQWNLPQPFTANGITAYSYSVQPEDGRIGVFCHEFGHILGLPDLYDTTNKSEGVGVWCLMGAGSWNNAGLTPAQLCIWAKARLNWTQPQNVAGSTRVSLNPIETDPAGTARVWSKGAFGSEYFLIENRQRHGFDMHLPGDGLLIWHINDLQNNNNHPGSYRVGLCQADGRTDLEFARNQGDPDDAFPGGIGNTRFDDISNPAARDAVGNRTGITISQIAVNGGIVTCDISV